ncbi:NAD(P)-binding protein, partial [Polychaeton citri CBS 116435]
MPVEIFAKAFTEGASSVPLLWPTLKALPYLAVLGGIKVYFSGYNNASERKMHGRVVMVTGGTSGVGAATVRELATKGAQIVLLTQHALSDPFLVQYIEDLREDTNNQLITAEQVDMSSLHSIRTFATKWIDNAPPRRLDMVILCANTQTLSSEKIQSTNEGVELNWQLNYLSNFHLLSILSPALRAQPPDRDVRILFGTCSSYMGGDLLHITQQSPKPQSKKDKKQTDARPAQEPTKFSPSNAYATSKYALTVFALTFQKHLTAYKRPDKMPMNTKVILVDPGFCRTPGTRRWLTAGTLWGLLIYLLLYPLVWLFLKSPNMGAQSFLHASMEERYGRLSADMVGDNISIKSEEGGGWLIKECKERRFLREDVKDEAVQKALWEYSEKMIEEAEKRGKEFRTKIAKEKKDAEE